MKKRITKRKAVCFRRFIKRAFGVFTAAACTLSLASCNTDVTPSGSSTVQPVTITVWSYYNGVQLTSFEKMVNDFNSTAGRELGVYVETVSMGSVSALSEALLAAGEDELPDIFSAYADQAYEFSKKDMLVDFCDYMTAEELDSFVAAYLEDGRIGADDVVYILPVAKATEVLMLNKTLWDEFSQQTGAELSTLSTVEGFVQTAALYYEWTDAKTPDIPDDGKAFFGRDALINMLLSSASQLDSEIFSVSGTTAQFNGDKEAFRKIWDNYYIPYINGYFAQNSNFASDDLMVGEIVCYVGSTSSSAYFPTEVESSGSTCAIEGEALYLPVFEGGKKVAVSQGAGMAVIKSEEKSEDASVSFLKWFTEKERNLEFSYNAGYLPVKKDANNYEMFKDAVIESGNSLSEMSDKVFKTAFEQIAAYELCSCRPFEGCTEARSILASSLEDKFKADRERVVNLIASGTSREDAVALFDTEENFEEWFELMSESLQRVL